MRADAELILVGGGLANGLIAWHLAEARPEWRVLLLEAAPRLGGEHTWSFHQRDLTPTQHAWLAPLVEYRWPAQMVRFPERTRRIEQGYLSLSSTHFDRQLQARLGAQVWLDTPVVDVKPCRVRLADGRTLHAQAVIDGRGAGPSPHLSLGYQKFLGQELLLREPHGLQLPLLMDADLPQQDGYRFVYLLPLDSRRLLVEDTRYADGAAQELAQLREEIAAYVSARGWQVERCLREERGVLPIILAGDIEAFWREATGQPRAGLAAGLFHATTGYSLPDAVRLAERLARLSTPDAAALHAEIRDEARRAWQRQGFFRLLNRMLFLAAEPQARWRVMQRFYGLPEPLIARFYAGRPTLADKLRILSGKPPVPLGAALRAALARHPLSDKDAP